MLDPDISTEDALHLLSRPSDLDDEPVGPQGWTRRTFLQAIGAGVFGGAAVGTIAGEFFGGDIPEAWAGTPIGANDGIVVVVTLYGGYDGLNTFVPYGDGNYYSRRANIAIPQNQVLAVNSSVGFAPQLTYLKTHYREQLKRAFESAVNTLDGGARNLLRQSVVQRLTVDQIGALYGVHRATAARRVEKAREDLLLATRTHLMEQLHVEENELDSIMNLLRSRMDLSVGRVLCASDE